MARMTASFCLQTALAGARIEWKEIASVVRFAVSVSADVSEI
jgi:hypothetical protein